MRQNCFSQDSDGWSLNRVWIKLTRSNVLSNHVRILKPSVPIDSTRNHEQEILLLERGPVTSTFNTATAEVEYSCKLRVMHVGGTCRDVEVR